MRVIQSRASPCQSWYLDFSLIADYWVSAKRAYHHTAPISMIYALREALRMIDEEGLMRERSSSINSHALMAGLDALGCTPITQADARLTTLHCVALPPPSTRRGTRKTLLQEYGIEIGAGLGPLQGKAWRIGLMGESSTRANVEALLGALEQMFLAQGWIQCAGAALDAAARIENVASK